MSLEKIAQYKEEIEKIASRAWKRNLGKIGEKGIDKLVESGVLDRKKELKGLRRGTQGILKKEKAKMLRNPEHFAGISAKSTSNLYDKAGQKLDAEDIDAIKTQLRYMGPAGIGNINVEGLKHKGVAYTPKDISKQTRNIVNNTIDEQNQYLPKNMKMKNMKNIPRKDRESKKWQQAILERHETDEVRFGNKVIKNKKHTVNLDGINMQATTFGGHVSPKVLVAESSHVALAPKNAKNSMKHLRNFNQSASGYKNTEMGTLKTHSDGKFQYGASGVYDKKTGKKLENKISNMTKQQYRDMGYDV